MSNKGLLIILLFTLSLLGGVCTGMSIATREMPQLSTVEAVQTPSPTPTFYTATQSPLPVAVSEKYMVTLTDTKIVIYKVNSDNTMQLIDEKPIDSDSLRREDYEALFKGVMLDSLSQAREMLEDYIS